MLNEWILESQETLILNNTLKDFTVVFQKIEMFFEDFLVENNERGEGFMKCIYTRNTTNFARKIVF